MVFGFITFLFAFLIILFGEIVHSSVKCPRCGHKHMKHVGDEYVQYYICDKCNYRS